MESKKCGVMGNPIKQSRSPDIHQIFAKETGVSLSYQKILVPLDAFSKYVKLFFDEGGYGLNITAPFKEEAYKLSFFKSERAKRAEAANILFMKSDKLACDNTDGIGFIRDISKHTILADKRILILGAGGATRGIIQPILDEKPKALYVANRTEEKLDVLTQHFPEILTCSFDKLSSLDACDVIVHATSMGFDGSHLSLPATLWQKETYAYDLSYNLKEDTPFVHYMKAQKIKALDGFGMLVEQAAESFYIWHGKKPATEMLVSQRLLDYSDS